MVEPPGPGAAPRRVPALARMVVGADLGGTKLAAVLVDGAHTVVHRIWLDRPGAGLAALVVALEAAVAECQVVAAGLGGEVGAVGLAVAGWLSADREHLVWGANLSARDHELGAELRGRLQVPVVIENDGNATALGEFRAAGLSQGCMAVFTFGTGVGGGVIVDGRPLIGARGLAGELGHMPVTDGGGPCVCGGRGCLELFTSGPGLARAGGTSSSFEVVAAARAGDAGALGVLSTAGKAIGRAAAVLVAVVDPDIVVLAGSLAHAAGEYLLPAARSALAEERPLRAVRLPPPIELGRLGRDAGAIGAAELVLDPPASASVRRSGHPRPAPAAQGRAIEHMSPEHRGAEHMPGGTR